MSSKSKLLEGYLSEAEMAAEINRGVRTLQRWRTLQIGPPYTLINLQPVYNLERAREWLAAGGTAGSSNRPASRRRSGAKRDNDSNEAA